MAHKEQIDFVVRVKQLFPDFFENKVVLDIGAFDVKLNPYWHISEVKCFLNKVKRCF